MTDEWMIEVIAKRISEECPWSDAKKVLAHEHWRDVIEHLWKDKGMRSRLLEVYQAELHDAAESESDSLPL